jgi:hypothetical protein
MDTIIIGIDWKHYQYFTQHIITAKEKSTKRAILIPGIWAKIRTMIGCSNKVEWLFIQLLSVPEFREIGSHL